MVNIGSTVYNYAADGSSLASIQSTDSTSDPLAVLSYSYDLASRVTSITNNGTTTSLSYNADNEITGVNSTTYSYDSNGNRNMSGYSVGTNNETSSDGTYSYTYDAAGNMTEKYTIASGNYWTYNYNQLNQLVTVSYYTTGTGLTQQENYEYDVFGNLTREVDYSWVSGVWTSTDIRHAYDIQGQAFADVNSSGTVLTEYLLGNGPTSVYARVNTAAGSSQPGNGWILTNNLGSVVAIQTYTGGESLLDQLTYDAYGNITTETNQSQRGAFGYTGLRSDLTNGLDFAEYRTYNPQLGQWMSEDPIGFAAGDANIRRYVGDEVTDFVDLSGAEKMVVPIEIQNYQPPQQNQPQGPLTVPSRGKFLDYLGAAIEGFSGAAEDLGADVQNRIQNVQNGINNGIKNAGALLEEAALNPKAFQQRVRNASAALDAAFDEGLQKVLEQSEEFIKDPFTYTNKILGKIAEMSEAEYNKFLEDPAKYLRTRGIDGLEAVALQKIAEGLVNSPPSQKNAFSGCFAAGTPIRLEKGYKPIERIQVGDYVLSRHEVDPTGIIEPKRVLEVFARVSPILKLTVSGREIFATGEHPFYVPGSGWMLAGELKVGYKLLGLEGDQLSVTNIGILNEIVNVYNLKIEDYQTYFVGGNEWGFAVWSHNQNAQKMAVKEALESGEINPTKIKKPPNHHIFPQAERKWFEERLFDIDEFTVELDEGTHSGLHHGGGPGKGGGWWNEEIMKRLKDRELELDRKLTPKEIEQIGREMMKRAKIGNLPIVPYKLKKLPKPFSTTTIVVE